MTPKVSVCIPTYNRKKYLKEALESVFSQSFKDYEVVVVDDGSIDGTSEMIDSVGYDVRYYQLDHVGQSAARNKLIELAQGDYITFLDADDLLFPDAVEKLVGAIDEHGPDVFAYGSYVGIDENVNQIRTRNYRLPSGDITADLFEFIYVKSCGTMCAKSIYEREGGFDVSLSRCAMYKLLLNLSLKYRFIPVDGPTYKKRRHKGNIADHSFDARKTEFDVLENFYFNGHGKDVIPRKRAMKRLSKEGYRAGRCAINEGLYMAARQLLGQSLRRYPNVKSLFWWTIAAGKLYFAQRQSQIFH